LSTLKDVDGRDKPGHDEFYLSPAAPDQDQPNHRQRRAVPGPLNLAYHEARLRPVDVSGALADPEQTDQHGENAGD
jgi:hypothetical protein